MFPLNGKKMNVYRAELDRMTSTHLLAAFDFDQQLLQRNSELHWLDTPEKKVRVLDGACTVLAHLTDNPERILMLSATLLRFELSLAHHREPGFYTQLGIHGATEALFIRNLSRASLVLRITERLEHDLPEYPAVITRPELQFDPALLVLFPTLCRNLLGDELVGVSEQLRQQCHLVSTLYDTPEERYAALTILLDNTTNTAPKTIDLPAGVAPADIL